MRICFFNRSYAPDHGATGQLLTELAEDLVHHYKCEVTVVAGRPLIEGEADGASAWGWPVRRDSCQGVQVFRAWGTTFRPAKFQARVANYVSYFLSACLAGLQVPRPDIVVSLTDPPIIALAALLCARRSRARFVFVCEDVFPEVARLLEDFHSDSLNRVLNRLTRFIIHKADQVVALGDTMRRRLIEEKGADPRRVIVIHNWADCSSIIPGPKQNAFSVAYGLDKSFVVMHSGNVGLSQNLDPLLDAAERLRQHTDIIFTVVGDGAKRADLEARAKSQGLDNVRFLPHQRKDQVVNSFASADVFIVSLKPGLAGYIVPSKVYGILAAGRPYIAAVEEACEVVAITKEYNCGLLAMPTDADDLSGKILTLYHDRDLTQRLGGNARQAGLQFDRRNQVARYYSLFAELAHAEQPLLKPHPHFLKRPFDVILSGLGLILSAPLWLLISLIVKLEDGGPVFYAQERVGKGGRRFRSLKFRSMVPDADKKFGPLQAGEEDPRVTRIGLLLRVTAMDELPQLWNIFRGDMSFVGPRALMPEEIEVKGNGESVPLETVPGYEARHEVRPGLTGIAQIYAPRDLPRRQKFLLDRLYIKKQTFCLDLKLITLSFLITFSGRWEHRGRKV